ncbi:MAG: metalloregulator ArsR/SmtB family transcription factor [Pseudomonadota bacterium]
MQSFGHDELVEALRAVAEPTRLRIVNMLRQAELTVSDLVSILDQSQPRVSRHLKLMAEAGVIDRSREGTKAFYRLAPDPSVGRLIDGIFADMDPASVVFSTDAESLTAIRQSRIEQAGQYFAANAERWDEIRSLHLPEAAVEEQLAELVAQHVKERTRLLDIGTGTGRMLQVLAPMFTETTGLDRSAEMLAVARARIEEDKVSAVHLRQGNLFEAAKLGPQYDAVVLHMVLHFLEEPGLAVEAAARTLRAGGRLFVVDFEPHDHEFLRVEHNHLRSGLGKDEMDQWADTAGLERLDYVSLKPDDSAMAGLVVGIWVMGPKLSGNNPWT